MGHEIRADPWHSEVRKRTAFADGQVAVVGDIYFKRGEYWLDEQQAKEHAETLRQRRVSALMRELERLQAVK